MAALERWDDVWTLIPGWTGWWQAYIFDDGPDLCLAAAPFIKLNFLPVNIASAVSRGISRCDWATSSLPSVLWSTTFGTSNLPSFPSPVSVPAPESPWLYSHKRFTDRPRSFCTDHLPASRVRTAGVMSVTMRGSRVWRRHDPRTARRGQSRSYWRDWISSVPVSCRSLGRNGVAWTVWRGSNS